MSKDLKVAVITGAGTGIGRAAATSLAEIGFSLVLAGRRAAPLEETATMMTTDTLVRPTDVTDPEAVGGLFSDTKARFGRVDVLFNNAGVGAPPVDLDTLSVDDWQRVIDTNLTGPFLCARAAMGMMKTQSPRGGRIINNGSVSAHVPRPNSAPYTATKHAITGLTRSISLDGRKHDIACCQLDVGNAGTDMGNKMLDGVPQADGSIKPEPVFDVAHCGSAVAYMAGLPLDTNVQFMTIMARDMPYVGRG